MYGERRAPTGRGQDKSQKFGAPNEAKVGIERILSAGRQLTNSPPLSYANLCRCYALAGGGGGETHNYWTQSWRIHLHFCRRHYCSLSVRLSVCLTVSLVRLMRRHQLVRAPAS